MSDVMNSPVLQFTVAGGGTALDATTRYSAAAECKCANAVLVVADFTKSTQNLTIGLVLDRTDSANATIAASPYKPILSTRQSSAAVATTHTIAATDHDVVLSCNLGGLAGKVRLSYALAAAGAVGDVLAAEISISEGG